MRRDVRIGSADLRYSHALLRCVALRFADYCAEGAAAALPCPAGKRMDTSLSVMDAESDCITCGVGTFCPVGSEAAQNCAPGTYNDQAQQETCTKCAAGTFQELEGKTACEACTSGCEHCIGQMFSSSTACALVRLC